MARGAAVLGLLLLAGSACTGRSPSSLDAPVAALGEGEGGEGEGEGGEGEGEGGEGEGEGGIDTAFSIAPGHGSGLSVSGRVARLGVLADGRRLLVVPLGPDSVVHGSASPLALPSTVKIALIHFNRPGVITALSLVDDGSETRADDVLLDAAIGADGHVCLLTAQTGDGALPGALLRSLDDDGTVEWSAPFTDAVGGGFVATMPDGGCIANVGLASSSVASLVRFTPDGAEAWHVDVASRMSPGPIALSPDAETLFAFAMESPAGDGEAHVTDATGARFDGIGDSPAAISLKLDGEGALLALGYDGFDMRMDRALVTPSGPLVVGACDGSKACRVVWPDALDGEGARVDLETAGGGEITAALLGSDDALIVGGRTFGALHDSSPPIAGNIGHAAFALTLDGSGATASAGWIPSTVMSSIVDAALDTDGTPLYLAYVAGRAERADGTSISTDRATLLVFPEPLLASPDTPALTPDPEPATDQVVSVEYEGEIGGDTGRLAARGDAFTAAFAMLSHGVIDQGGVEQTPDVADNDVDVALLPFDATGRAGDATLIDRSADDGVSSFSIASDGTQCLLLSVADEGEGVLLRTRSDGSVVESGLVGEGMTVYGNDFLQAGAGSRCDGLFLSTDGPTVKILDDEGVHPLFTGTNLISAFSIRPDGSPVVAWSATPFEQTFTSAATSLTAPANCAGEAFLDGVDLVVHSVPATEPYDVKQMAVMEDGTTVLVAYAGAPLAFGTGGTVEHGPFALALSSDGDVLWVRTLGDGPLAAGAPPVFVKAHGDRVIVAGNTAIDLDVAPDLTIPGSSVGYGTIYVLELDHLGRVERASWIAGGMLGDVAPGDTRTMLSIGALGPLELLGRTLPTTLGDVVFVEVSALPHVTL